MHSDAIKVTKRQSWSSVPDLVLEHPSLSLGARLVLAWMLGRAPNWEIRVGPMCFALHLSEKVWRRVRDELCDAGFFSQQRFAMKDGKVKWLQEVSDAPLYDAIPPKRGDGAIPPKSMDGVSMDAGGGGIPPPIKHKDINHHQVGGGGICPAWQEAVDYELAIEEKQRGLRNPAGLRRTILQRYAANGGPGLEVLAALEKAKATELQAAATRLVRERSAAAAATAAAVGSPPPATSQIAKQLARARELAADKSLRQ